MMADVKNLEIPKPILRLGEAFRDAGLELYLVGGYVRDKLLGDEEAKPDADATTRARPGEIKRLLRPHAEHLWDVGERFGTIGATVGGFEVEVTTYRSDLYTEGSRHPEVRFGESLEEDLARRDFTINAVAADALTGDILDPFEGRQGPARGVRRGAGGAGAGGRARRARLRDRRRGGRRPDRRYSGPLRGPQGPREWRDPGRRGAAGPDARRPSADAAGRPLRGDPDEAGEAIRARDGPRGGHPGECRLAQEHKSRADERRVREGTALGERLGGPSIPRAPRAHAVYRAGVHGDGRGRAGGRVSPQGRLRAHPDRGPERGEHVRAPQGGVLSRHRQAPHPRLRAPLHLLRRQEHAEDAGGGRVRGLRRAHHPKEDPLLRPRERRGRHSAPGHEAPGLPQRRDRRRRPPRRPPHASYGLRGGARPVERLGRPAPRPGHGPRARRAGGGRSGPAPQ